MGFGTKNINSIFENSQNKKYVGRMTEKDQNMQTLYLLFLYGTAMVGLGGGLLEEPTQALQD